MPFPILGKGLCAVKNPPRGGEADEFYGLGRTSGSVLRAELINVSYDCEAPHGRNLAEHRISVALFATRESPNTKLDLLSIQNASKYVAVIRRRQPLPHGIAQPSVEFRANQGTNLPVCLCPSFEYSLFLRFR
jgi:hypothetical protein